MNGGWESWILGKCNVTCGKGYLNCTRECNNPAPAHGGSGCVGSDSDVQPCDEGCCSGTYVASVINAYTHSVCSNMQFPTSFDTRLCS